MIQTGRADLLASVNCSFSTPFSVGRSGSGLGLFDARKHDWYPATFIPEIPFTLIEVLSSPGDLVYDPFAGIGTTLYQALALGRRPIAADVCAIAVEAMRSFWTLFGAADLTGYSQRLGRLQADYDARRDYAAGLADDEGV